MSFIEPSMLPDDVLSVYPNGLDPHAGYKVSKDGIILEDFVDGEITVDKLLDNIDLKLEWYQPSADAHEFMTFIRLCLGEEPENSNPITHYFFIDCFFKSPNVKPFFMVRNIDFDLLNQEVVILCSREFSKSTLVTYLILFMASKGYMPGFGKVNFGLYVADSMDNNVKIMMNKIKKIYYMSSYLQNIFEYVHFTDVKIEMVRKPVSDKSVALWNQIVKKEGKDPKFVPDRPKRTFSMMGKGCQTSTRGASDALYRPQFVFLDDLVPNEKDAYSEAILNSIESTIEADVRGGLSGNGYFMGCIGTPYNKKDPVYKRVENGAMLPIVFPRGNVMPTDEVKEEDWISVWPDRHDYKACKREYDMALRAEQNPSDPDPRKMKALRQEHYLRIRSESDAMISVNSIKWYNIESILRNISMYNIVVTTDFTSSQAKNSDFSGAAVWAVSSNEDYFLLDLTLRRMGIDEQYNNIFKLYDRFGKHKTGSYVYEVGIEIDGNQQTHLYALDKEQLERGKYFEYAKQVGAPKNRVGILSRGVVSENKSKGKIDRLKLMVPKFEKRKIWFPEELKDTSDMKELLEELKYCTNEGKGTKHDDGLDLISQLALIDIQVPTYSPPIGSVSKVDRNGNYQSGSKEVVTAHYNQAIWNRGDSDNYDDYDNGYC